MPNISTEHRFDWQTLAACAGTDTELFYDENPTSRELALGMCRGCPVQTECLQWAINLEAKLPGSSYGIIGGKTPLQRVTEIVRQKRGLAWAASSIEA